MEGVASGSRPRVGRFIRCSFSGGACQYEYDILYLLYPIALVIPYWTLVVPHFDLTLEQQPSQSSCYAQSRRVAAIRWTPHTEATKAEGSSNFQRTSACTVDGLHCDTGSGNVEEENRPSTRIKIRRRYAVLPHPLSPESTPVLSLLERNARGDSSETTKQAKRSPLTALPPPLPRLQASPSRSRRPWEGEKVNLNSSAETFGESRGRHAASQPVPIYSPPLCIRSAFGTAVRIHLGRETSRTLHYHARSARCRRDCQSPRQSALAISSSRYDDRDDQNDQSVAREGSGGRSDLTTLKNTSTNLQDELFPRPSYIDFELAQLDLDHIFRRHDALEDDAADGAARRQLQHVGEGTTGSHSGQVQTYGQGAVAQRQADPRQGLSVASNTIDGRTPRLVLRDEAVSTWDVTWQPCFRLHHGPGRHCRRWRRK
nr:hypothetical protein CFP56_53244 [Quercus suber]